MRDGRLIQWYGIVNRLAIPTKIYDITKRG